MSRKQTVCALWAAAFVMIVIALADLARAADYCGPGATPDLFYNYYVGPVQCGGSGAVGAAMYPTPYPVPPRVGLTYITYQPLLPQEFLYQHNRTYYKYNGPHNGLTETIVKWH